MKEDIERPVVKDVAMAVMHEESEIGESQWTVVLLNYKDEPLDTVLITSTGYGRDDQGLKVETSTLRRKIETLPAKSFAKIEPIMEEVFGLHNEYLVSFFLNDKMYDKKFIFLAESIKEENLVRIPGFDMQGILISD